MQLDIEESTPASACHHVLISLQIGNCHNAITEIWSSDFLSSRNLVQSEFRSSHRRTDRQTDSDAYEPTVHTHSCAQKAHVRLYTGKCQSKGEVQTSAHTLHRNYYF